MPGILQPDFGKRLLYCMYSRYGELNTKKSHFASFTKRLCMQKRNEKHHHNDESKELFCLKFHGIFLKKNYLITQSFFVSE